MVDKARKQTIEEYSRHLMRHCQIDFEAFMKGSGVGPGLTKAGFKESANATFAAGFASGMGFIRGKAPSSSKKKGT